MMQIYRYNDHFVKQPHLIYKQGYEQHRNTWQTFGAHFPRKVAARAATADREVGSVQSPRQFNPRSERVRALPKGRTIMRAVPPVTPVSVLSAGDVCGANLCINQLIRVVASEPPCAPAGARTGGPQPCLRCMLARLREGSAC